MGFNGKNLFLDYPHHVEKFERVFNKGKQTMIWGWDKTSLKTSH